MFGLVAMMVPRITWDIQWRWCCDARVSIGIDFSVMRFHMEIFFLEIYAGRLVHPCPPGYRSISAYLPTRRCGECRERCTSQNMHAKMFHGVSRWNYLCENCYDNILEGMEIMDDEDGPPEISCEDILRVAEDIIRPRDDTDVPPL